jgi:hypothetical protein
MTDREQELVKALEEVRDFFTGGEWMDPFKIARIMFDVDKAILKAKGEKL